MSYFSKQDVLKAYTTLTGLSPEPQQQGATQKVSIIRYFVALDMFYKLYGKPCDTKIAEDKKNYCECVGSTCAVCVSRSGKALYTTNFSYPLREHNGDYSVGSNFFSVGQVSKSLTNTDAKFSYPKRSGWAELFYIQNGVLLRDTELYNNFSSYIPTPAQSIAFMIWLLRKVNIDEGPSLYERIESAASKLYTNDLLDVIFKDRSSCEVELQSYGTNMNDNVYCLSEADIKSACGSSSMNDTSCDELDTDILQLIIAGSPGSGKSYKIDSNSTINLLPRENRIRTIFHPESDYSSFVGCYKPITTRKKGVLIDHGYSISDLVNLFFKSNTVKGDIKARYWYEAFINAKDIERLKLKPADIAHELRIIGFSSTTYMSELSQIAKMTEWLEEDITIPGAIRYEFTPQAFTKAYIQAWKCYLDSSCDESQKNVFLIIEEINRGNCAQIFGDLFQLLDRDDFGFSKYAVQAEKDLADFLNGKIGIATMVGAEPLSSWETNNDKLGILLGEELCLPPNLHIWATMNTSDQGLFPMDSAFKRRWDWEYEPIKKGVNDYRIIVDENHLYDWWTFLMAINAEIQDVTSSSDKKIGYWFVKPNGKEITLGVFVCKVISYLWSDVFKNVAKNNSHNVFKFDLNGKEELHPFDTFFNVENGMPDSNTVIAFMNRLSVPKEVAEDDK